MHIYLISSCRRSQRCPQCRQQINMQNCKTVFFSMDKRSCSGCSSLQAAFIDFEKQSKERNKWNDEKVAAMKIELSEKHKRLNAFISNKSELQAFINQQNVKLAETEKSLKKAVDFGNYQMLRVQQITDSFKSEISKLTILLDAKNEQLKDKKSLIEENDEIISELRMKLNGSNEQLKAANSTKKMLQTLVLMGSVHLIGTQKVLAEKKNELVVKKGIIDLLNSDISKIEEKLTENKKLLEKKNTSIKLRDEMFSEIQIKLNDKDKQLKMFKVMLLMLIYILILLKFIGI